MQADLKQARLDAGITIEEVAQKLNISKKYLIALEENDTEALPGKVYMDGYLKLYTKFLKIEQDSAHLKMPINTKTAPNSTPVEENNRFKFYLILISLLILISVIIVYPIVLYYN